MIVHGAGITDSLKNGQIPSHLDDLPGSAEISQCFAESVLAPGDLLYLNCQGGGGYGDPLLRDPESVAEDVGDGLVSVEAASAVYGVILSDDGTPDKAKTQSRREEIRAERRKLAQSPAVVLGAREEEHGRAIDDNLVFGSADDGLVSCKHCGQQLSDETNHLHLATMTGDSSLAGPGVRAAPEFFVDEDIYLHQYYCPSCFTAVHTGIAPKDTFTSVDGFALAH